MGNIRDLGRATFRDYATDGVPASGPHEPRKGEVRGLFDIIDAAYVAFAKLEGIGSIEVIKTGVAALNADLAHGNNTLAAVITDNEANAGIYQKSGSSGSGSWSLLMLFTAVSSAEVTEIVEDLAAAIVGIEDLWDYSFRPVTGIGGTANSITGTASPTIASYVNGQGFTFPAALTNTGPVDINIDALGNQNVFDEAGRELPPGSIVAGNLYFIRRQSGHFRVSGAVLASGFETRDDDGVAVTDGSDVVAGEFEPSGALALPAILTEAVGGVSTGFLRRQQLPGVVDHLPLAIGNFIFGQSNALANWARPPISTLRSARNMRTFNAGVRAYEGVGTPTENRFSLIPHVETDNDAENRGETAAFGAGEAFCDLIETEQGWGDYASRVLVISAASGEGGSSIADLMEEEPLDRFLLDVEAAAAFALAETGRPLVVPALFWNQIEEDVKNETAPASWKAQMIAAQALVEGRINEALGYGVVSTPTVPWIIPQVATWNKYDVGPELAIAAVELCQTSDKFILLPSYPLDFPDDVHTTAASQHGIVGPRVGFIHKRLAINGQTRADFAPTAPITNDREGKFAWFQFHTWAGDPLTVDSRLVRKVANFGLQAFASNGTTPKTINKVHVLPTELVIEYAANPVAGDKLTNGLSGTGSGWNEGPRSNLRTTHGDHVTVRTMQGVKPVHEWVPAFSYTLT